MTPCIAIAHPGSPPPTPTLLDDDAEEPPTPQLPALEAPSKTSLDVLETLLDDCPFRTEV